MSDTELYSDGEDICPLSVATFQRSKFDFPVPEASVEVTIAYLLLSDRFTDWFRAIAVCKQSIQDYSDNETTQ